MKKQSPHRFEFAVMLSALMLTCIAPRYLDSTKDTRALMLDDFATHQTRRSLLDAIESGEANTGYETRESHYSEADTPEAAETWVRRRLRDIYQTGTHERDSDISDVSHETRETQRAREQEIQHEAYVNRRLTRLIGSGEITITNTQEKIITNERLGDSRVDARREARLARLNGSGANYDTRLETRIRDQEIIREAYQRRRRTYQPGIYDETLGNERQTLIEVPSTDTTSVWENRRLQRLQRYHSGGVIVADPDAE